MRQFAAVEARRLPPGLFETEELDDNIVKVLVRMEPEMAQRLTAIAKEETAAYFAKRHRKKRVSRNDVIVRMLEQGIAGYDADGERPTEKRTKRGT